MRQFFNLLAFALEDLLRGLAGQLAQPHAKEFELAKRVVPYFRLADDESVELFVQGDALLQGLVVIAFQVGVFENGIGFRDEPVDIFLQTDQVRATSGGFCVSFCTSLCS